MKKSPPPLILIVLLCVILSVTQVSAGVNDNVVTAKLESEVGAYEDPKEAHTVFGLLHYLVYQIDQLRSDLANVQIAVSQIKVSSDMQNETVINTYLQQLKDGKYTSIAAYTSSVKIQEAMATSPIVINSDRSGFALDWLIANGRDLNVFFSQLDGFNYTVPTGYTIDQFVADDNCWNRAKASTFGRYALSASAVCKSSAINNRATTVYLKQFEHYYGIHANSGFNNETSSGYDFRLYNVILLSASSIAEYWYRGSYEYPNGSYIDGSIYMSGALQGNDIIGNTLTLLNYNVGKNYISGNVTSSSPRSFVTYLWPYHFNTDNGTKYTITYVQL